jgi:V/A-type H+-transporting ATPase subunit A
MVTARLFEDGFLRQNAFDRIDAYCSPARQYRLLALLLHMYRRGVAAIERGSTARRLSELAIMPRLVRARSEIGDDALPAFEQLHRAIDAECAAIESALAESASPVGAG